LYNCYFSQLLYCIIQPIGCKINKLMCVWLLCIYSQSQFCEFVSSIAVERLTCCVSVFTDSVSVTCDGQYHCSWKTRLYIDLLCVGLYWLSFCDVWCRLSWTHGGAREGHSCRDAQGERFHNKTVTATRGGHWWSARQVESSALWRSVNNCLCVHQIQSSWVPICLILPVLYVCCEHDWCLLILCNKYVTPVSNFLSISCQQTEHWPRRLRYHAAYSM